MPREQPQRMGMRSRVAKLTLRIERRRIGRALTEEE
jgi:hypothetical protein